MKADLKTRIQELKDWNRSLMGDAFTVEQRKANRETIYQLQRQLKNWK